MERTKETGRKDAEEGEDKKRGKMLIKANYVFFFSVFRKDSSLFIYQNDLRVK